MKIRNLVFGAICGIIFFSCSESGGGKEVEMDRFVTDLMGKMTIREKLGQLNLPSGGDLVTGSVMNSELSDMIRKEEIGGFFNVKGIKKIYDLQRLAVEENRCPYPDNVDYSHSLLVRNARKFHSAYFAECRHRCLLPVHSRIFHHLSIR